ncbi:pyridoxal phosphate-dependent transferase [Aspergillus desertorum]
MTRYNTSSNVQYSRSQSRSKYVLSARRTGDASTHELDNLPLTGTTKTTITGAIGDNRGSSWDEGSQSSQTGIIRETRTWVVTEEHTCCEGYNPPEFLIKALQDAVERVEGNQYSPPLGRLSLRKVIATSYSTHTGREINADEFLITTGSNEGILSIIMGYVNPGDEVIIMEPLFDQIYRTTA